MKVLKRLWCRWFGHKWGDWAEERAIGNDEEYAMVIYRTDGADLSLVHPETSQCERCGQTVRRHRFEKGDYLATRRSSHSQTPPVS